MAREAAPALARARSLPLRGEPLTKKMSGNCASSSHPGPAGQRRQPCWRAQLLMVQAMCAHMGATELVGCLITRCDCMRL
jgi:hypothetical protein